MVHPLGLRCVAPVALVVMALLGTQPAKAAPPIPDRLATVRQAIVLCHTRDASPGPGWGVFVYGYYVASPLGQFGYLIPNPGSLPTSQEARQRAVHVDRSRARGRPLPTRSWLSVYGTLRCPTTGAGLDATRWEHATSHPPVLQVFLSVRAPPVLRVGREAVFRLTPRLVEPLPLAAYDVDFRLGGRWAAPTVRTPDGSQACDGDNVPRQPTWSRGYWRLDLGDCRTIDLVLTPTAVGRHSITMRPFRVPLDDRGMPIVQDRIEESHHRYVWQGTIQR